MDKAWFKQNLIDRKDLILEITTIQANLLNWQTIHITNKEERNKWFILWQLEEWETKLEKLSKRHYFLKRLYRQRKAEANNTPLPAKDRVIQYDIERIKEIPIKDILANAGISIVNKKFFKLRNERTPSANFNEKENYWYDFGSGEGGDVISLYQKLNSVDFKQAIKELNFLI